MVVRHLNEIRRNFVDDITGFLIDAAMSAQITGIMIGYPPVRLNTKIKIFQKLTEM